MNFCSFVKGIVGDNNMPIGSWTDNLIKLIATTNIKGYATELHIEVKKMIERFTVKALHD